jgi:dipeptidyl aminopeptidase/acylaminoacyl peptidase
VSTFTLTDAAIERALAPDLHVAAPNDFTDQIAAAIAARPGRSAVWLLHPGAWRRQLPLATRMLLLLLLLGVLLVGAIAVASLQHRGAANGHVIVGNSTELLDIDPETGDTSTLVTNMGYLFAVTRSVDGSLISFWTSTIDGLALQIFGKSGGDVRQAATNVTPHPVGQGQIDVFSPDGRSLASGVMVGREQRILLVDIASGEGGLIGPPGAGNPLWSPDGKSIAFSWMLEGRSVLAVMAADGTGDPRVISGDLGDLDDSGTNNFSPDGAWVYFGAERNDFQESHIFRARVDAGGSEQLTFDMTAAAPALSPDGTLVAYADWSGSIDKRGVWIMDADGGNQHLLLADAANDGWSNDGEFLLLEWQPPNAPHELVVLRPDGTDQKTLMTFERSCADVCAKDLGWGQPRP